LIINNSKPVRNRDVPLFSPNHYLAYHIFFLSLLYTYGTLPLPLMVEPFLFSSLFATRHREYSVTQRFYSSTTLNRL